MRQIFYIEADEEMISVIGRLRKSNAIENIIVAPQHSLILQSIVNLRLLQHDARKNGKEIIVVTQDHQSKSLCEKIGIQTQTTLDGQDIRTGDASFLQVAPAEPATSLPQMAMASSATGKTDSSEGDHTQGIHFPRSDTIGSSDYFTSNEANSTPSLLPDAEMPSASMRGTSLGNGEMLAMPQNNPQRNTSYVDVKHVSVRDKNSRSFPSLNSQRFEEEKKLQQQKSFTPPSLRNALPTKPMFTPTPVLREDGVLIQTHSSNQGEEKHPLWFRANKETAVITASAPSFEPMTRPLPHQPKIEVLGGERMQVFFLFFFIISLFVAACVGAYVFLPKASVEVTLKVNSQQADFEFNGSTKDTAFSAQERVIPVRLVEKDGEITQSFDATGVLSLADKKSRGSVAISNAYSADPQTLVASTRLLSSDGKVFRLKNNVTVPGMTRVNGHDEAGTIETLVIADQSGSEYNIDATSFTIPGFEGTPKYTKFEAKSLKAMTGGGSSGSNVRVISEDDIARAKKVLESDAKAQGQKDIADSLSVNEKTLDNAVNVTVLFLTSATQAGVVADSFEYTVKIHSKALVFDESDMKMMISTLFTQQNNTKGISLSPHVIDLEYGEPTADFASATLRIKVHATGKSDSSFDSEQLKSDLLGQNENNVDDILKKYPQIQTISVSLWPPQLPLKTIPSQSNRVTISITNAK
jgi:hypothetical protein